VLHSWQLLPLHVALTNKRCVVSGFCALCSSARPVGHTAAAEKCEMPVKVETAWLKAFAAAAKR
jgi:hypothetical protein